MFQRRGRRALSAQEGLDSAECYAFVSGVHDSEANRNWEPTKSLSATVCIPPGTNGFSLAEIVANYLDKNPAMRDLSGALVTLQGYGSPPAK